MTSYPPRIHLSAPAEAFPNLALPSRIESALGSAHATSSAGNASQSSASTKSDCSAEERLQWRNHDAEFTPSLATAAMPDPFEACGYDPRDIRGNPSLKRRGDGGVEGKNELAKKDCDADDGNNVDRAKLSFRERIRHFTWTWFCMTMATGGISNVLYAGMSSFGPSHTVKAHRQQYRSAFPVCTPWAASSSSSTSRCSSSTLS